MYSKIPIKVQILPSKDVHDGQRMLPISSNPNWGKALFKSIKESVERFKANILIEHQRDGKSYGYVSKAYELDDGLYGDVHLRHDVMKDFLKGQYRWVSPFIVMNDINDQGDKKAGSLIELSFTSTPRNATNQVPLDILNEGLIRGFMDAEDISELQVSQMSVCLSADEDDEGDSAITYFMEMNDMDAEQLKEMIAEVVAAQLADMKTQVIAELSEEEEDEEVELSEEEEEDKEETELSEEDEEVSQLLQRIAELEEQLELKEAEKVVADVIADNPHLSSMSQKLVNTYRADTKLYGDIVSIVTAVPAKGAHKQYLSRMSEKVVTGAVPVAASKAAIATAIERAKKEGKSFTEAYKELNKG